MYYYKARIYSPTLGRFLQTDPIGYERPDQPLRLCRGDPVNFTDPTGLCGGGEVGLAYDRTSRGEGATGDIVALYRFFCVRLVFDATYASGAGVGVADNSGGGVGGPEEPVCKGPPTPEGVNPEGSPNLLGIMLKSLGMQPAG